MSEIILSAVLLMLFFAFMPAMLRASRLGIVMMMFVLVAKAVFVVLFNVYFYDWIFSTDGDRYYWEILSIAESPFDWNPLTGEGPNYRQTAKLGMQYIYGVFMFLTGGKSLYSVLALNIFFNSLCTFAIFSLSSQLGLSFRVSLGAAIFGSFHPELLFWSARVTRENLSILLPISTILLSILISKEKKIAHVLSLSVLFLIAIIVRVQLAAINVFVTVYFAALILKTKRLNPMVILLFTAVICFLLVLLREQLSRSVGVRIMNFFSLDLDFWLSAFREAAKNAGGVVSLGAKQGYGSMGILLAPFSLFCYFGFLVGTIKAKSAFPKSGLKYVYLCSSVIILFYFALMATGSVNIRFRTNVTPILIVVAFAGWSFVLTSLKKHFEYDRL